VQNERGFLKASGASFIAISALGHSLLRPGMTVADTLPGNSRSPLPGKPSNSSLLFRWTPP